MLNGVIATVYYVSISIFPKGEKGIVYIWAETIRVHIPVIILAKMVIIEHCHCDILFFVFISILPKQKMELLIVEAQTSSYTL